MLGTSDPESYLDDEKLKPRKTEKMVHGIGRNDASYPVTLYDVVNGRERQCWICPFYLVWKHMLARCYSTKYQADHPTYMGCSVVLEWLKFSVFRSWMELQPWAGNQLDKDILFPGNKVYGPHTCVFVSGAMNNFMNDYGSARGEWPLGVYWDKQHGKFRAQCNNPFTRKRDILGRFYCPESAHEAWRKRKHELACIYADQQTDPRIASALRSRYANSSIQEK